MLIIDQLGFRYKRRFLFRHLSFSVEPGQLWHVKGPNGCGKSTLMKILTGKLTPNEGEVTFADPSEDIHNQYEYLAAEQNGLFGELSALANLRFWLQWKISPALADDALWAELKAWGFKNRLASEDFAVATFSTGMKRKLALARVVLSRSPLWLLDEPLYGLDDSALKVFRARLSRHCSEGGAVVTVSHDLSAFAGLEVRTIDLTHFGGTDKAAVVPRAKGELL